MTDTVWGASGHTDDGEPWEVVLLEDGRVTGLGLVAHHVRVTNGQTIPITPTGPYFVFDARNAAHIAWLIDRRWGGAEDSTGDPPGTPPPAIPPLPPGAVA